MKQHYFLYGGTTLNLNPSWTFSPSVMARMVANSPFQMDVNAVFNYNNTLDVGPMLRSLDALGMLIGLRVNEKWYLGYQYEYPFRKYKMPHGKPTKYRYVFFGNPVLQHAFVRLVILFDLCVAFHFSPC